MSFEGYDNELLHLAHDLAVRLLPAFEHTDTGIPYPRVSELLVIKKWLKIHLCIECAMITGEPEDWRSS